MFDLNEILENTLSRNDGSNGATPKKYNVEKIIRNESKKFDCEQTSYKISFPSMFDTFEESMNELIAIFKDLHVEFVEPLKPNEVIRIVFSHSSFPGPVNIDFMTKEDLTQVTFFSFFEHILQSYKTIAINKDNSFYVNIIIAHLPFGMRKRKNIIKKQPIYEKKKKFRLNYFPNHQSFCSNQSGIINITNSDNLCGIRAILIAKAYEQKECIPKADKLEAQIDQLFENCKLDRDKIIKYGLSIQDFREIEHFLKSYQITIFRNDGKLDKDYNIVYQGPFARKFIYISYTQSHYNVIKSVKRYFNRRYYCHFCKYAYSNINDHSCNFMCKLCKCFNCQTITIFVCKFCEAKCKSIKCYNIHTEKICVKAKICNVCNSVKLRRHVCGEMSKWCFNCKQSVGYQHKCFILREDEKKQKQIKLSGYIFFDYEAYTNGSHHVPNLIVAIKISILDIDKIENFMSRHKFFDNKTFCDWLFAQKYYTAMAHNFKGYDSMFIMSYLVDSFTSIDTKPKIIMNGTKVISIKFRNVRIIDSYSFIPIALDKFATTFSVPFKKQYFPHLFNLPENQDYVGVIPDKKYFFTSPTDTEFDSWYEQQNRQIFDFKLELENYCTNDVLILMHGCLAFRRIILKITKIDETDSGVDPFKHASTMPALSHYIYRRNFMKKNSIGVIPTNGYNPEQKVSNKAMCWLKWISETNKCDIQHAKNKGEYRVGKYLVDGFCSETNTIYEFHGCFFHGCQKCYPNRNTWNSMKQSTMGYIYQKHLNRIEFIKNYLNKKYNLIEMWECDWDVECKTNGQITSFNCDATLNPRDALYGGRTEAVKLHHECKIDEKICYYDINSLYPFVQKSCLYPIGHPIIQTENFENVEKYFGLIYCRILPPRNLFFPVLPSRINGKLVFTLCNQCAILQRNECVHDDEQRCLEGTWVSVEILEALKHGYKINKIFVVWHWENKSDQIWSDYITVFHREKQKAEQENNIGMKNVLKWLLNCLWGRYGLNTDKTNVKFVYKYNEWIEMLLNKNKKIHNIDFSNETFLIVFYSYAKDHYNQNYDVSVVLAAFVTCHARLVLFNELVKLDKRILYYDTDSIIFLSTTSIEYMPTLFDSELGQFKDELKGKWIVEFVSAGCKNYAYVLNDGTCVCVIKGFALNGLVNLKLNFENIKNIVLNDRSKKIIIDQTIFSRDKFNFTVSTKQIAKNYAFVFDKRILKQDLTTLPFGFNQSIILITKI